VAAANQAESNSQIQAAAQQQAAQQQAAAAKEAAYQAGCSAHHGYIAANGTCEVDYPGSSQQRVTLNDDGSFDQQTANYHQQDCAGDLQDYQQSTADNGGRPPAAHPPQYHPDTGVCITAY
jgi:hypothetical protein